MKASTCSWTRRADRPISKSISRHTSAAIRSSWRGFGPTAQQSLAQRRQEIGHVREIIAEELDRHRIERTAREAVPIITSLRTHADDVRAADTDEPRRHARAHRAANT